MKKKKILCFDIDGVICKTKGLSYSKSIPIKKNIKKINDLYNQGFYIKIFTARYMGRSNENIFLASKKGYIFTKKQLFSWGVKFHKLIFGKPTFDLYIDDKNLFHNKKWPTIIEKYISKINKLKN